MYCSSFVVLACVGPTFDVLPPVRCAAVRVCVVSWYCSLPSMMDSSMSAMTMLVRRSDIPRLM